MALESVMFVVDIYDARDTWQDTLSIAVDNKATQEEIDELVKERIARYRKDHPKHRVTFRCFV